MDSSCDRPFKANQEKAIWSVIRAHVRLNSRIESSKASTSDQGGLWTGFSGECTSCDTAGDDAVRRIILCTEL